MLGDYHYICGIDSGTNTGVAVYYRPTKKLIFLETMMLHRALPKILNWYMAYPGRLYLRIEDANKASGGRSKDAHRAVGAGSVMRDGRIWRDFAEDYRIPYELCKPNRITTKFTADLFKRTTGWTGKTNSHTRDAGMLCWGY